MGIFGWTQKIIEKIWMDGIQSYMGLDWLKTINKKHQGGE